MLQGECPNFPLSRHDPDYECVASIRWTLRAVPHWRAPLARIRAFESSPNRSNYRGMSVTEDTQGVETPLNTSPYPQ